MKTKFTTIIALAALFVSTNITKVKADNGSVELTEVGAISKIEANGNVDVYLVNGDHDAVKVYNDYYSNNAVVSNVEGVLRIASYATEKLVVMVTVTDLEAITANDNASVRSYNGTFLANGIEINANDKAIVQFKIDAVAANIFLNGEARAELAGTIENYQLNRGDAATVNSDDLKTFARREVKIEQPKRNRVHAFRFALHASL